MNDKHKNLMVILATAVIAALGGATGGTALNDPDQKLENKLDNSTRYIDKLGVEIQSLQAINERITADLAACRNGIEAQIELNEGGKKSIKLKRLFDLGTDK